MHQTKDFLNFENIKMKNIFLTVSVWYIYILIKKISNLIKHLHKKNVFDKKKIIKKIYGILRPCIKQNRSQS